MLTFILVDVTSFRVVISGTPIYYHYGETIYQDSCTLTPGAQCSIADCNNCQGTECLSCQVNRHLTETNDECRNACVAPSLSYDPESICMAACPFNSFEDSGTCYPDCGIDGKYYTRAGGCDNDCDARCSYCYDAGFDKCTECADTLCLQVPLVIALP